MFNSGFGIGDEVIEFDFDLRVDAENVLSELQNVSTKRSLLETLRFLLYANLLSKC